MATQPCPACGALNDVSIFVSGQSKRCDACGLTFKVQRSDPTGVPLEVEARPRPARAARAQAGAQPVVAPLRRPRVKVEERPPEAPAPEARAPAPEEPKPREARTDRGAQGLDIPGFDLHEVIGKGGMGKVYRAVQRSLHREVAIKVLNEDLAKHPSFIKRFEKEAHSLAALQHPNIATIHDTSHVGPHYYLVMEYIGGHSLRHMLNQGRLPLDQVGALFGTLCKAVDHAHRHKVIHRDLKPENVLFTLGGVLKVVDFGLANILDEDGHWELTRTKVSMGTVNYMAPEQRRDAKHVDHRADIYSLGVMLYEMITGELPLGRFEDPSRHRPGVPAELDQLVARMLDFEPDRRPQSAELVAATLDRVAARGASAVAVGRALPVPPPSDAQAAGVGPAGHQAAPAVAAEPAPRPAPGPRARPRQRRLRPALLFLVGGSLLAAAGAVIFFSVLLRSDLAAAPGDVVLKGQGGALQMSLVHPHEVRYLPPAENGFRGGQHVLRYDFRPSTQASLPVRFLGGDWGVERAVLTQDTSRSALTVNQIPARALFGPAPVPAEGLGLAAGLRIEAGTWSEAGTPRPALEVVAERLPGPHAWLPADLAPRVGLGLLDEQGALGLQVLLPLPPARQGWLLRIGPGMEGGDERFELPPAAAGSETRELRLTVKDGRVRLSVGGEGVVERLAGFPVGFRGLPAVLCQNARCSLSRLEISTPAGAK